MQTQAQSQSTADATDYAIHTLAVTIGLGNKYYSFVAQTFRSKIGFYTFRL